MLSRSHTSRGWKDEVIWREYIENRTCNACIRWRIQCLRENKLLERRVESTLYVVSWSLFGIRNHPWFSPCVLAEGEWGVTKGSPFWSRKTIVSVCNYCTLDNLLNLTPVYFASGIVENFRSSRGYYLDSSPCLSLFYITRGNNKLNI